MMEMNCEGTLLMPTNCVLMDEEEMTYVDGGVNIGMYRTYLNKEACLYVAGQWVRDGKWTNVTATQIAHEIFGHAVGYYKLAALLKIIPDLKGSNFYSHVANGVDINNVVDKYQSAFDIIWNTFKSEGTFTGSY
ncbi:hypothetical protein C8E03_10463 [Lachnotalea glycerini]|uniref:Uncharacterized protein n=1 Tax=Lachnotalea glycerini TaxID=1763509 RepID=A0A318ENX7_9FIRM|nr:hypothetical protein [Lachnotalea glycerini]OYP43345.1 hypothetical protein CG709_04495 [Lachnotalea glycerini]PXV91056.1 hypothetical protein C8E03_10463 [Lachnotalea glycerini]